MQGAGQAKMTCKDNYDGSCTVEYIPFEPGDYEVSVKFADQHIPGSPFQIPVVNESDASKVNAHEDEHENKAGSPPKPKVPPTVEPNKVVLSGLGVSPVCTASFPVDFVVDTSKAGYGDLEVQVLVSEQR